MKNRNNLNLLIDVLLFVVLTALAGIGWLMKWVLLPGRDRILKTGENRELLFLGWDRHQWGTVHLVVALVMLGLLVLHIVFHWKTMLCMIRNAVPSRLLRLALTTMLVGLGAVLLLVAFVIRPERSATDDFLYRNARGNRLEPGFGRAFPPDASGAAGVEQKEKAVGGPADQGGDVPGAETETAPSGPPPDVHPGEGDDHRPGTGGEALLNGRMTLDRAASACGISPAEVRRRLGLPGDYPGTETLGRIRRTLGITLVRVRELLENGV